LLLVFAIFLIPTATFATNNVHVDSELDIIPAQGYTDPIALYFEIENDYILHGLAMGFNLEATGELAAHLNQTYQIYPEYDDLLNWDIQFIGPMPYDTFVVSAYKMPDDPGFPPGPNRAVFEIDIYVEECSFIGDLCIDSCMTAGSASSWLWTESSGQEIFPEFNSNSGPICFEGTIPPCGLNYFTDTPVGDELMGNHCQGVQFQFIAEPGLPEDSIIGFDLCPGAPAEAEIDNNGLFTFSPSVPGSYGISIRALGSCPSSEIYDFTVNLTNTGLDYYLCPSETIQTQCGELMSCDLGLSNLDCDAISEEVSVISSPAALQPSEMPECDNGIFSWLIETGYEGLWTYEVQGSDPYGETASCQFQVDVSTSQYLCGDANSDGNVNVSDAVQIINYVFIGGESPQPYLAGDTNCDNSVNVSDAVWIINYVFIGGAEPCDC
jgi:hypothetical protein